MNGADPTCGYSRPEPDIPANLLMTVENTSIVDAVGTDKETGEVRLSIFDHLPWDTEHLRLLQGKNQRVPRLH